MTNLTNNGRTLALRPYYLVTRRLALMCQGSQHKGEIRGKKPTPEFGVQNVTALLRPSRPPEKADVDIECSLQRPSAHAFTRPQSTRHSHADLWTGIEIGGLNRNIIRIMSFFPLPTKLLLSFMSQLLGDQCYGGPLKS